MSHSELGTSQDLGGSGTITISPADGTKLYRHQGRYIVATIKNGDVDIPAGAMIDFSGSPSDPSANLIALPGEQLKVKIDIDQSDKTQGTARVCIRHDPSDGTNRITVAPVASGWGSVIPPAAPTAVTYTVLDYDPTITLSGPTQTLLPLPSHADGDELAPGSAQGKYTTQVSCKVVDTVIDPPTEVSISDYVVEWHEGGLKSSGLFSALVNAYTSATATYDDRLAIGDGSLIYNSQQDGYYVRMVTNSEGVASLYLVAKSSSLALASSVIPQYDFTDFTPLPLSFLIVNSGDTQISGYSPIVEGVTSIDTGSGTEYWLDFATLTDPPNVKADINAYQYQRPGDQVYLVVNGAIVAGPHIAPNGDSWTWSPTFPDSLCHSNEGPNAGDLNQVLFVVANPGSGEILPSGINGFYGTGENQPGVPQAGPLETPRLFPATGHISLAWLKANGVAITVDLQQSSQDYGWTPKAGDRLTAVAFMRGYGPGGRKPKSGSASATGMTLGPSNFGPNAATTVTLPFPDITKFEGYDSQQDPKFANSMCYIVYTVQPVGQRYPLNSGVLSVILNTANRS